jgi:hypothetical protein
VGSRHGTIANAEAVMEVHNISGLHIL